MASLPEYNSIEEKAPNFHYERIDSEDKLNNFIEEAGETISFYRGMKEAKYKLYSSSQREWIEKELVKRFSNYDVFINEIIGEAKQINNSFIETILKQFGTNGNELAILSYLQHYGAPTPLIDFTINKFKALFFAIDGAKHIPGDGITNYISLYTLKLTDDFTNLRDVLENAHSQLQSIATEHPSENITNLKEVTNSLETYAQAVSWDNPIYLSDIGINGSDYNLGINSNINIVAQEGIFVLNPSEDRPLEEQFHGITLNSWVGDKEKNRNTLFYDRMYCVDIHKSFIPLLENKLRDMNIYSATMYPQNEEIAKSCYKNILK